MRNRTVVLLVLLALPMFLGFSSTEEEHHDGNSMAFVGKIVNFLVLFGGLGFLMYKPVLKFLDARGREIEHNMKETADNRRAAEGRLNDARRRKDELTREISSIRDEAESQGGREKERILAETESEAQRLKNQATQDIETLSRYGVSELRAFAAALATRRAGQRIRERLTPDDHSRLIDQSIERLEKLYEKPSSG